LDASPNNIDRITGLTIKEVEEHEVTIPDGDPALRPNGENSWPLLTLQPMPRLLYRSISGEVILRLLMQIAKVALVRPMAVTHQTESEQWVLQLPFLATGPTEVTATAPNGWHPHALAPRGWYMVFLVDTQGVPSVGQFMHLH
jgi:hypothetical protein